MNQIATRHDFRLLSEKQQDAYEETLECLRRNSLSCRCEMNGKDFTVVVAPGLSSAKYWQDRFDIHNELT